MKIKFECGLCRKSQVLNLTNPNRIYLIGAKRTSSDFPRRLDIELCSTSAGGQTAISGIQAHIKYRDNKWRIFDGVPQEYDEDIPYEKKKNPASYLGTFLKREKRYILIGSGTGLELLKDDCIYFVPSKFGKNKFIQFWEQSLPDDIRAVWQKEEKSKAKLFDGFKYFGKVIDDKNIPFPGITGKFSDNVKINGENLNYCVAIDITGYTNIIKEDQPIVISEFNSILDSLLSRHKDYISIPVGDGIYTCFLGARETHDVHFRFALDFIDRLKEVNKSRDKKWHVRIALTHGYDRVMTIKIADIEMVNVYGNCINTTSRLLSEKIERKIPQDDDEIIAGTTTHQEIHNMEFYKENFKQESATIIDKHKKEHHCFIYTRK